MRLAFSVAVHVEPQILLIDEILAVGDVNFQKKCIDKIKEFKTKGVTIVFVSHNMEAVSYTHLDVYKRQDTDSKAETGLQDNGVGRY